MSRPSIKSRIIAAIVALPAIGYAVLAIFTARLAPVDDGPFLEGAPVRASVDGQDGVFVLTSMWRTQYNSQGRFTGSVRKSTVQYLDLWRFDPATGTPVWRRRLQRDPKGARTGFRVLGVAGGKLWYVARTLRAASLADGQTVFDTSALFERAPALRTTFPSRESQLRLDTLGLHLQGADGRGWRIDPASLAVTEERARGPWEDAYAAQFQGRDPEAEARVGLVLPAVVYPSSPNGYRMANAWLGERWVGITTDEHGDSLREPNPQQPARQRIDGYATHEDAVSDYYFPEVRTRLWGARVDGTREVERRLRGLAPLPASESFLQGGFLHDASKLAGASRPTPLRLANPAGLLVLARTRLDEADTLVLARVDVTDGATRWRRPLPLSIINGVMPGDRHLVLHGKRYRPSPGGQTGDPASAANEVLVFVDLGSGDVRHWMLDLDHARVEPLDP